MKKIGLTGLFICTLAFGLKAQESKAIKFASTDKSPLDVVYYPLNATKSKGTEPVMRVLYSRPYKNGREIFGVLEPFDKVWRVGANESTELDVFKPIVVGGKKIAPGRYSLFAIPQKDKWTVIINKQVDRWGAFAYQQANDVVRVECPVGATDKTIEVFSITFVDEEKGINMVLAWDNTQVMLPIELK